MNDGEGDIKGFDRRAERLAQHLLGSKEVLIIGHIDADGISAASIAYLALIRANIKARYRFVKRIDEDEIKKINTESAETIWLVDLGSGHSSRFDHPGVCICDHHVPEQQMARSGQEGKKVGKEHRTGHGPENMFQSTITQFFLELNPMEFGFDGSRQISGAGVTYWVARSMNEKNKELAGLAIIGAVGDFQDADDHHLFGLNRRILEDGEQAGVVQVKEEIAIYGRETRPLVRLIQYSGLPLPWLKDWEVCRQFFREIDVSVGHREALRTWVDLDQDEKDRVVQGLRSKLEDVGKGDLPLLGEAYLLCRERPGTELHDAKEYATMLNSCGRYNEAELGLSLCITSRKEKGFSRLLEQVNGKLRAHKSNLKGGLDLVLSAQLVKMEQLRYYRLENDFGFPQEMETTLGSVLGMLLGSGKVSSDRPVLAFAHMDGGGLKVSARASKELVARGLDLARVMNGAAEKVGEAGGGHNIAAGATCPNGAEETFLAEADRLIGTQIGPGPDEKAR
jgi:single-stranded-DNA-specific exonuclease